MAFVYLLCDLGENNLYKIGVTKGKIEKRIKQLQTGNGNEISLINFYETKYPFAIERLLHIKFNSKQLKSEWFELENDDVFKFKEICANIENNIESLENNAFKKLIK
jgi:hypothetical protein